MLDRERLTVYPRIFVALYVTLGGWWLFSGQGLLDRAGTPIGADFVAFYAISALAHAGRLADAWDVARLVEVERAVLGAPELPPYAFHYPPTFALALVPLAALPYLGALVAWWAATTAAFAVAMRRLAPLPVTLGLAFAFPGFFQNVVQGQNGAFTAAILGGGLSLVDRRPAAGGALLAALTYKPHLAPLVGVALLAGRRWRALGAFLGTAGALVIASLAAFGAAPWRAFLGNVPFAVSVLETEGALHWFRMPTVQAAAMQLGASPAVARPLQAAAALGATAAVAWAWGTGAPLVARGTVTACAALLATPFAFDYDLAVLAVPIALIGAAGARDGFRRGEAPVLVAAWAAPLALPAVARATGVSLAPLLFVALIGLAARRSALRPA